MNGYYELDDFEIAAKAILTKPNYDFFASGADGEITLKRNRTAFADFCLLPRILPDEAEVHTGVDLLGASLRIPMIIAPTAFHKMAHPLGELATTQAAKELGTLQVVSTASNFSLEEIADSWGTSQTHLWFQLSVQKEWKTTLNLIRRAETAGYRAIVVTVDAPVYGKRLSNLRNQFQLPKGLRLANFEYSSSAANGDPFTYPEKLSWKEISRIREATRLPMLLKGILSPLDSILAIESGFDGIVVSNHGGRQLDTSPATIEVLGHVCRAVQGKIPVIVDGGFRKGTDVLKALALGARAVALGRPVLWGLAVGGKEGVKAVFEILEEELGRAMRLCGVNSVASVPSELIHKVGSSYLAGQ
jgi:4-hydroxymandelate oxidase